MFVVCEQLLFGYFPTVWIFPTGFFPQRFFRAGVWAHPAKLTMCLAPALCVRVCCWWKVHRCGWNVQACTTTLNQFSVMGGGGEGGRRAVDNGWEGAELCIIHQKSTH